MSQHWKRKIISSFFFLSLVALVLVSLFKYEFSPKVILSNAKIAARALYHKYRFEYKLMIGGKKYEVFPDLWYSTERKKSGVLRHDRNKAGDELVFYSDARSKAYLIDREGNILHKWERPYSSVWKNPKHVSGNTADVLKYFRRAELMPNGDIIAIYEGLMQTPYGGGMIRLDKDSNLLWKLPLNTHHDLDIDEDGNILVLYHKYEYVNALKKPIISDGLALVSPTGKLLKKTPFLEKFIKSIYSSNIPWEGTDPFHTNNVEIIDAERAAGVPMFEEGDIIVSMVGPSAIFLLDGKSYIPKWKVSNITKYQHDPDIMPGGIMRIFDNHGLVDEGHQGASRIIDIDVLDDNKIIWQFDGNSDNSFFSKDRGSQDTLKSGNILVTESTRGRIFEVTLAGEIVWEFIDPSLEDGSIGVVNWATAHNREDLSFIDTKGAQQ